MENINPAVTIGVAIRYEQPDKLRRFVRQLSDAAHLLDSNTETEVCFCLNGATKDTKQFLRDILFDLHDPDLHFTYLESAPGKIRAHEVIAEQRKLDGFLLFADADIQFEKDLFYKMYNFLAVRPDLQACYSEVSALPSVAGGIFGQLQNAYYLNRHHLPTRAHLHGRCFMLREWNDEFSDYHSHEITITSTSDDVLSLQHGPIVDDIHYSRVLIHRFGRSSIAIVPDVNVHFVPPHSRAELYRDSCRTEFELFRLDVLFPEHATIEQKVFQQRVSIGQFFKTLQRLGLRASIYLGIERTMRRIARFKAHQKIASLSEGGISPSASSPTMVNHAIKETPLD